MKYALVTDANGNGIGSHSYTSFPKSLPANEIVCTKAQAATPMLYTVQNGKVVESLSAVQTSQDTTITAACQSAIEAGFSSSALGSAYTYGSGMAQQLDIGRNASFGGSIWCADSNGMWALRAHSVSQAKQVMSDMHTHVLTQQTKLASLRSTIYSSGATVSSVKGVTW